MSNSLGIGSQFGPYLLKRLVGSGGMGSVFEAEDTTLQRSVALKLISATFAQDHEYRERLQREARIAGRLRNPHVVPIHGAGEIDGQLYVDMRLIDGVDLETTLTRSGRLSPSRAVGIVSQIASALDDAHAAGVLHRDVKPANILLAEQDFAYLVDFGIANAAAESRLTQAGEVIGTWAYMAPERLNGDDAAVTGSADVYALACVLFEALTGSPPFQGNRVSLAGAHIAQPPPRPSAYGGVPAALDEVIARGMAKDPQHRYATAGALARAAQTAIQSGASSSVQRTAPPTQGATPPWRPGQSRPTAQPITTWSPAGPTAAPGMPPGPPPQYWAPPVAARPATRRKRWPLVAAAVVLVVALAVGGVIWKVTSGPSKHTPANAVDLSALDVGKYGTEPRTLPANVPEEQGRFLAAFGMAEGVVIPYDVDSDLSDLLGVPTPDPKIAATMVSGNSTPVIQPVLEQFGMTGAFTVFGQNPRPVAPGTIKKSLRVLVTAYRNEDAASKAAVAMDDADFAQNANNQHATIPGYPQAHAHYDPIDSSIAATMASGYFAVSINYGEGGVLQRAGYFDELTQKIRHVLDLQMPLMADLQPVFDVTFTQLPTDPDGMLRRAFVAGAQPPIAANYGTLGPRGAVVCAAPATLEAGLYAKAGVDRCARTPDGSLLLRARDDSAASTLLTDIVAPNRQTRIDHVVAPPGGLNEAVRCYELKQSFWADHPNARFDCVMAFGRYVAFVDSSEEKDVRQRAAAQYAILVNSA